MDSNQRIGVAIAGLGGWGPNLLRCAAADPDFAVRALCDPDEDRLASAAECHPEAARCRAFKALLARDDIDALVLATPAGLHAAQTRAALDSGRHVLVEKPLALSTAEARSLADLAAERGKVLMVGHTFQYNGAVERLAQLVDEGRLGRLNHASAERLSLGRVREDVDAWWNLAPHDVSILLRLFGGMPERVRALGGKFLPGARQHDVVNATLEFPGGRMATIHCSWLNPLKVRRMTLLGDRRMALYDDVEPEAKLRLYDRGVDSEPSATDYAAFRRIVRMGGEEVVDYPRHEPLAAEVAEFAAAIREGRPARTGPAEAIPVTRVLEACQESMENDGRPVEA